MRRVSAGLVTICAVPLVVSCGGDEPEVSGSSPATETVTVTVTAEAESEPSDTSTASAASATTEDPSATEAQTAAETEAPSTEVEDSADAGKDFGSGEQSDRGYVQKELGQWAGIGEEDDRIVDFRLTDIETEFPCDQPYADPPANGQFVALTFEVETFPGLADDDYFGEFTISEYDIVMFDESGKRENDSTGNGYMCLDEQDRLPMMIGPGQTAEGKLVIDTGVESGTLAIESYLLGGRGGWEWPFPG